MMRRRHLLLGLVVAGCASPDPVLYRLTPVPGPERRGAPALIELRQLGLPGYLDRPQLIRAAAESRLEVVGGARWGEPLGDLAGRILAEDLMQRLPGSSVFTETGTLRGEPGLTIEVEVQRFESGPDPVVHLLAQVALRTPGRRNSRAQVVRLEVPVSGAGTGGIVAAMSAALGQLADAIAGLAAGS